MDIYLDQWNNFSNSNLGEPQVATHLPGVGPQFLLFFDADSVRGCFEAVNPNSWRIAALGGLLGGEKDGFCWKHIRRKAHSCHLWVTARSVWPTWTPLTAGSRVSARWQVRWTSSTIGRPAGSFFHHRFSKSSLVRGYGVSLQSPIAANQMASGTWQKLGPITKKCD